MSFDKFNFSVGATVAHSFFYLAEFFILHENELFLAWTGKAAADGVRTVRVELDALTGG